MKAVLAVALGGATGTLVRDLLLRSNWLNFASHNTGWVAYAPLRASWTAQIPWMLLLINVLGVFFATLALSGPLHHHDPNDLARLVVITGFFGGFTSYSGLFVDLAGVWHASVTGGVVVALARSRAASLLVGSHCKCGFDEHVAHCCGWSRWLRGALRR